MAVGSSSTGQLSYGSFYIPALASGYFSTQAPTITEALHTLPILGKYFSSLPLVPALQALTIISFIGAMEAHGIVRAIHGPDGPVVKPKMTWVVIRHQLAIIFGKEPEEIPASFCCMLASGVGRELYSYLLYRIYCAFHEMQQMAEMEKGVKIDDGGLPPSHRFETILDSSQDIRSIITKRNIHRIFYFLPMASLKHLSWISFGLIIVSMLKFDASYPVLLLLLAHVALKFRDIVWKPIPTYRNPEAKADRFKPEYEKWDSEDP